MINLDSLTQIYGLSYFSSLKQLPDEFSFLLTHFHQPCAPYKKDQHTISVLRFYFYCIGKDSLPKDPSYCNSNILYPYFSFSISLATNSTSVPTTICKPFLPVFLVPAIPASFIRSSLIISISLMSKRRRVAQ